MSASSAPVTVGTLADVLCRNNNKPIDLSRTIRLSGLSSGAKLEIVQASRSPSVVSVALQLPEGETQGAGPERLTDKFPSTTTLWLILRKFESGVAGGQTQSQNLTARGTPSMNAGSTNHGRLYYQTPVLLMMGRELSSFTDLQKTLGQLGFNSGSVLLRLSFRNTGTPLEEAAAQIEEYFKSIDGHKPTTTKTPEATQKIDPTSTEAPVEQFSDPPVQPNTLDSVPDDTAPQENRPPTSNGTDSVLEQPVISSGGRTLQVFAPPTSTTPTAARRSHNTADYNPTVEHAQSHQRMLSESSRNKRLPTEAEIEVQAAAEKEKLAAVTDVEIKIRFPDESAISARFGQSDTGASLYNSVRDCLDDQWKSEAFVLRNPGRRGKEEVVPDHEKKKLIQNLGLRGRVLVIFDWNDQSASMDARGTKQVLKPSLREQAKPLKVEEVQTADDDGDRGIRVNMLQDKEGEGSEDKGKRKGVPRWLQGLSKKK